MVGCRLYDLDAKILSAMRSLGLTDMRLIVACSGGVDSLALTDVLARLKKQLGLELVVAHFEHGIRGEESRSDAFFVEKVARARRLPFVIRSGDAPAEAAARGISLETAARSLRYEFLGQVRRERDASYILTAHHADDQAETIIMHLLRGTGTTGLAGMRAKNETMHIARPLLSITKQELTDYCLARDLVWREDSTNDVLDCTRNRIRLGLLPTLKRYNPNIVARLNSMGSIVGEEDDYLERLAAAEYQRLRGEDERGAYIEQAEGLDPVILRRVVRRYWAEQTGSGSAVNLAQEHTAAIAELLQRGQTGASLNLPQFYTAQISYGRLYIAQETERAAASLDDWSFTLEHRETIPEATGPLEFYFTPREPSEDFTIRYRQSGDYIVLKAGRKKLKDVFIDDKIPREERDSIPLLALGSEIIWIVGHRRSAARPAVYIKDIPNITYIRAKRNEEQHHDER